MTQENVGPVGTATMAVSTTASFISQAMPVMQFVLVCVSIVVGLLTAVWYIRRLKNKDYK